MAKRGTLILKLFLFFCWMPSIATVPFCHQFFANFDTREPLSYQLNDTTAAGTVIAKFGKGNPPYQGLTFNVGDTHFIDLDQSSFSLVIKHSVRPKVGTTLQIHGQCKDIFLPYNYVLKFPVAIEATVNDQNDPPEFLNLPKTIRVNESTLPGSVVFTVDVGDPYDIREEFIKTDVYIVDINVEGPARDTPAFLMTPDRHLQLMTPLDFEQGIRLFKIKLEAKDGARPPLRSTSTLTVEVVDNDDMPPRFTQKNYHIEVIGEKPVQKEEPKCLDVTPPIKAFDQDPVAKSKLHYIITKGDPGDVDYWSEFFRMNLDTGELCQVKLIERLLLDDDSGKTSFHNFTFDLKAYQTDDPSMFDETQVFVHVLDSNVHAPTFTRRLFRNEVPEYPGTKAGTSVIQVQAHDKDYGLNSLFQYELISNPHGAFSIDSQSGNIVVVKPEALDRERFEFIEFQVRAKETHTSPGRESSTRVKLYLEDLNDNQPRFEQRQYSFNITDNLEEGELIHQYSAGPKAHDKDTGDNSRLRYSITGIWRNGGIAKFSDYGRFMIDSGDGSIRLATSLHDLRRRRNYPQFRLTVTAQDQAKTEATRKADHTRVYIMIIEANDFPPEFPSDNVTVSLSELVPEGTLITKATALDEDGDEDIFLKYKILSGNGGNMFKISNRGWITVATSLDRERQDKHSLRVQVHDGKHKAFMTVNITVLDANDNAPVFTQSSYRFDLVEHAKIGKSVGKVTATDADGGEFGDVSYTIRSGEGSDVFTIRNGEIFVGRSSPILDRERTDKIILRVDANDGGTPAKRESTEVVITLNDLNDNTPRFTTSTYHGTIDEDDFSENPVIQVVAMDMPINATDQDKSEYNRDIRYFLVGEGADLFQMDDVRADITIKHPGTIDCETKCAFHFKVIASDQRGNGLQTKADVYIKVRDQNDNAPEFEKDFLFTLRGDTPPGTTFGQIKAIDRDITKPNNQMLYILKEGGFGKFTVDHDTGDITLVDPLEREPFKNEYKLHVQAIDGGQPRRGSYTDVIINVPINYPPFINQNTTFFPIMENLPAGSDVGKVEAFDPNAADDPTVKLKLSVKGDNVPFDIDNSSGMLRTNISLDRESQEFHFVSVVVTDNGHPPKSSSSTVTVMVLDDNDHAPTFMSDVYKGKVFEDDQRPIYGQLVIMPLNVSANDEDATQVNRDIRYSLEGKHNEMFAINAITGEIRVSQKGIGKIDRETMGEYHLKLVATDQGGKGISSAVDFIVRVEDLNDQSPTFRAKHSSMVVGQKVLAGQEIGDIQADDPDATAPNNEILYMLESDAYGKFKVDMKTGKVVVLQGIFFQPRQQSYILNVAAMDLGYPPRKTYGTVTVKVLKTDFNDFNPEIKGKTMFYTNEEVPIGTFIGKLNAVDADIGPGEKVALSIRADSPVPFKINSETGAIYTTGRLDRDGGNLAYTFEVVAKDQGDPPREARTQVGVILRDINDNPPTFTRHQYRHRVADTFPAGTVVATPFAYDDIDTQNSVYHYSMMGQKPGYFYIDSNSGVVLSTTRLKELGEQILKYKVIATDAYNNNLTAEAELLIDVSGRPKDRSPGKPCCCLIPCTNQTEKAEITNKINTIVNTLQHDSQDEKQNKKNMSAVSGTHNESGVSDEKDTDETSGDSP